MTTFYENYKYLINKYIMKTSWQRTMDIDPYFFQDLKVKEKSL